MIDLSEYEDRYSRLTLGQSMKIAWRRMKEILFKPFAFKVVMSFAVLGMLSNLNGGNKHVEIIIPYFPFLPLPLVLVGMFIYDEGVYLGLLPVLAGIGVWVFFEARLRLIFLGSIAGKRVRFFETWRRYKKPGRSFFIWEFAIAMIIAGHILFVIFGAPEVFDLDNRYLVIFCWLATFSSLLFTAFIDFCARRFILPLMCIKNIRLLDAVRLFLKLFSGERKAFLAYLFSSLGIHLTVVAVFFGVSFGVSYLTLGWLVGNMLWIAAWYIIMKIVFGFLLLPLQIWYQAWGLAFYGGFGDDLDILTSESPRDVSPVEVPFREIGRD